ncbi:hypothetical protein RugamoR57_38090 [Duganella caerulea]|uniref:hypothetical protein n=1 Tax=Duganella caerulea TaxID=2885762 RepID=UPI0030E826A7
MTEKLDLTSPEFTSRAVSFTNLMRTPDFKKRFLADPSGTAMREFHLKMPSRAISSANKAFASLMQDDAFNKWCEEFQHKVETEVPSLTEAMTLTEMVNNSKAVAARIQKEFSDGVASHFPEGIANKFMGKKVLGGQVSGEDDVAIVLLVFVAVIVVVVAPHSRDDLLSRNTVRLLVNQLDALKADISREH